jgi:lipid II isoglutaminyl synthase (glutamine-hydrolysing)
VTVSTSPSARALPPRASLAVDALRASNWLSRALGRGSGTVAGGRVGLALDPTLLATLARARPVALVTGTNGKTTTTRMLVAALSVKGGPVIVSNDTGANMPAGHVAALAGAAESSPAVLEVDEGYLAPLIRDTHPRVVVLLNLSRDQLDRISEVRMLVDRWRGAMEGLGAGPDGGPGTVVVANADDPMVVWAASPAPRVVWVGAGQVWHNDSVGCPSCGGRIVFGGADGWACERCDFARPRCDAWTEGSVLVMADGSRHSLAIRLPGQFNRSNAAMVAMAAVSMTSGLSGPGAGGAEQNGHGDTTLPSVGLATAIDRLSSIDQVAGRFSSATRKGRPVRLLLAKNPAGWTAIFDLLAEGTSSDAPVVLSINARTADGLDTSWLWDVPFERLAGRPVVATGDRRQDLAVRLRYAGVPYAVVADPLAALDRAIDTVGAPTETGGAPSEADVNPAPIDFLGNYTAFADLRKRL